MLFQWFLSIFKIEENYHQRYINIIATILHVSKDCINVMILLKKFDDQIYQNIIINYFTRTTFLIIKMSINMANAVRWYIIAFDELIKINDSWARAVSIRWIVSAR